MYIKDKEEILQEIEERDPDLLEELAKHETDPDILQAVADNDPYGSFTDEMLKRTDLDDAKYDGVRTALSEHVDMETLVDLFKQQHTKEGKEALKDLFRYRCPEIAEHLKDIDIAEVAEHFADILPVEEFYDLLKLSAMKNVDPSHLVMAMSLYERENSNMLSELWSINFDDVHRNEVLDHLLDEKINQLETDRQLEENEKTEIIHSDTRAGAMKEILDHVAPEPSDRDWEDEAIDDLLLNSDTEDIGYREDKELEL